MVRERGGWVVGVVIARTWADTKVWATHMGQLVDGPHFSQLGHAPSGEAQEGSGEGRVMLQRELGQNGYREGERQGGGAKGGYGVEGAE